MRHVTNHRVTRFSLICLLLFSLPLHGKEQYINHLLKNYALDLVDLGFNLFTRDTVAVAAVFIPTYFVARHFDEKIHCHFYDGKRHRNTHEWKFFNEVFGSDITFTILLAGLATPAFIAHEPCLQNTSRIFAETIPFLLILKKTLKTMHISACIRPFCQWFPKKKTYSGFPSGHLLAITYAATLFGSQLGPIWCAPLGILAGITFVDFVASNRHYSSQMIAGAGFGLVFGLAASKVVDCYFKSCENLSFNVTPGDNGSVSCKLTYQY